MRKWSRDEVYVTISKFSVHFRHRIESFHLHYVVLCLANAKINTLLADSTVSEKSVFPKKSHSDVSRLFNLVCAPAVLCDVYRLFTAIGYLAIQVACFNAILDFIANMIGRLLDLHIVESTPSRRMTRFLDLRSDVHVTF